MKSKSIILILIAILVFAGYELYRLGLSQGTESVKTSVAPKVAAERKPLYWHDPMSPGQRFDKPGKSPFMDMELVPVYADKKAGSGVSIDPRIEQNLGIRTVAVMKGKLESSLTAVGTIAFNERDVTLLQSRNSGYVDHVYVRATLDPVNKGQKLADVYVPDWVAAQEEYLTVKSMKASNLDGMLDGAVQRMRLSGMSELQIDQFIAGGKVQSRMAITSPINGVITELTLREGMTLAAGAPLFKINGLGSVWANAQVPESLATRVRPGDAVEASVTALSGVILKGRVNAILPEINPATRTFTARVELNNPHGALLPGMFASIHFLSAKSNREVVLVPSEAVIQTGTRSVVMVEQSAGNYAPVDIKTGRESNDQTEVLSGLDSGQKVVVSGQFLIDSEASLKGTALRMSDTVPDAKNQGEMK